MKKTDAVDQTAPAEENKSSLTNALLPDVSRRSRSAGFFDKIPGRFTADGSWLH
jgi:hypothetical protein